MTKPEAVKAFGVLMETNDNLKIWNIEAGGRRDIIIRVRYDNPRDSVENFNTLSQVTRFPEGK